MVHHSIKIIFRVKEKGKEKAMKHQPQRLNGKNWMQIDHNGMSNLILWENGYLYVDG